jgi:tRNA threonylcarbamoyladenosine modification (KEOPS) complex  Pcc1 subunit
MTVRNIVKSLAWPVLAFGLTVIVPAQVLAHCDSLDGPVVKAAQRALDARNPEFALIWVQAQDEPEIRAAFDRTLTVRALSPQAKELADRFFYEILVRVHRAGEGAPFTGLKPAGRDLGPAIPAADNAIEKGSLESVVKLLTAAMEERLREHFNDVIGTKEFRAADVAAGRAYVKAYVEFIHYVERVYEASTTATHGHFVATGPVSHDR